MATIDDVCSAADAALSRSGLQAVGSGHLARPYRGHIAGCPSTAQLSVFQDQNDRRHATGYRLTVEVQTGIPARLAAGKTIPVLLKRNLTTIPSPWPSLPHLSLHAHDPAWARRLVEDPTLASATAAVLERSQFMEHRPGLLQVQVAGEHPASDALPTILGAFDTLALGMLRPPGPIPAPTRWSDNRALVVALAAVIFFAVLIALGVVWWLV